MKKRILITGASGYFAWELVRQLKIEDRYLVIGASSSPEKLKEDSNYSDVKLIGNDAIWGELKGVDIVIHTAFCRKSVGSQLVESLQFSQELFCNAVNKGVKGIINCSSQSVYGSEEGVLPDENDKYAPGYMYALAKASSELLLDSIAGNKNSETAFTNIRLASLMGPSKNVPVNVLYKFAENVMNGKDINIQGGGQNFSFIDVRDAAEAVVKLLDVPCDQWDKAYNLGPEKQTNIIDLANVTVNCAVESGKERVKINLTKDDTQLNAGMNSGRIYSVLNWKPQYEIEDTVKATMQRIGQSGGGTKRHSEIMWSVHAMPSFEMRWVA